MKIGFFGTPKHSAILLLKLLDAGFVVDFVVTNPDKPAGRGNKLTMSPVKELAIAKGIEVFQFPSIQTEEAIQAIQSRNVDIQIVFAYGSIIPRAIFAHPIGGTINLHGSLLPEFRGASPIQSAILAGKEITGMSLQYIVEELDAGEIISQKQIPITDQDDFESLLEKITEVGTGELVHLLSEFSGKRFPSTPQDSTKASFCKKIKPEERRLDFTQTARSLFNKIRAFHPGNTCFAEFRGKRINCQKASVLLEKRDLPHGSVYLIDKKKWGIVCGDGQILVLELLQPENKKVMSALDFRNGMRLENGELFK
jgi:methionyl-tRNA formyltransferase